MNAAARLFHAIQDEPKDDLRQPNHTWLAHIIAAQRAGLTCLPRQLGLSDSSYDSLINSPFVDQAVEYAPADDWSAVREELLDLRRDEWLELSRLLLDGRRGREQEEVWLAEIVAAGCLGGNHLWRDLGLTSRLQLRELLTHNFPRLAMCNVQDMRWKKFFYKQLCEQNGGYVCRSPSCGICPTYDECYGEES
ncbi:MAG TPA: nitrogen fixation protein NifQ [Pseudomonas sp.]|jgi:nitrogen fixation protein NifQ|uniref:nitrogen fixation protein NifQ n=1 Tax=Pseudomonas sp. TaxID=306 RepID=UPI002ED959BC